jgi:hypothetical protein
MVYLREPKNLTIKYFAVLYAVLLILSLPFSVSAQSDPFGQLDRLYLDSVTAAPGQDVVVKINMENDEPVSSLSIPIAYDTSVLKLKSISFSESRGSYIANKLINPSDPSTASGKFLVTFFTILEEPIAPGTGQVCSVVFGVAKTAATGTVSTIDSAFYPPGGQVLFVENSTARAIKPAFVAGKVTVVAANQAPVIEPIAEQRLFEGDSLVMNFKAKDPDGDNLTISCSNAPSGVYFKDNHDGTAVLRWKPDFVGPYSSDGSPFNFTLLASDGHTQVKAPVSVAVVNKNRRPVITVADSVVAESGDMVDFSVTAEDPDFEPIHWKVGELPPGASFDNANPGRLSWHTSLADTGIYNIMFVASDPQGYADTSDSKIRLNPTSVYTLSLDTVSAYPGNRIKYHLLLDNKLPVHSFDILFNYDKSALLLTNITNEQTRSAGFEYFVTTLDENSVAGNVRIKGVENMSGTPAALSAGDGAIATISYTLSSDLSLSGMYAPINFQFLDFSTLNDNTMTDSAGVKIPQTAITYNNGFVNILSLGQINVGDINLNGVAYEISDVIYFTNFFMNPIKYPLNPLQRANSDVNHDNVGGTIGDLVSLINIVISGTTPSPKTLSGEDLTASISTETHGNGMEVMTRSGCAVGAVLLNLRTSEDFGADNIENLTGNMTVDYDRDGDQVRVLLYSLDGETLPSGSSSLIRLTGLQDVAVSSVSMASADGQDMATTLAKDASLPSSFTLHQNYPNPFNPETRIDFELPSNSRVALTIYNVLGKQVSILINDNLPAGVHSVVWDGKDDRGNSVASGVYLYRIETDFGQSTRKMMLLK